MAKRKRNKDEIDVREAIALMSFVVKENAKRYRKQKRFAEKIFGEIVKRIQS